MSIKGRTVNRKSKYADAILRMFEANPDRRAIANTLHVSMTMVNKVTQHLRPNSRANMMKGKPFPQKQEEVIAPFREVPKTGVELVDWIRAHKPLTSRDFNRSTGILAGA